MVEVSRSGSVDESIDEGFGDDVFGIDKGLQTLCRISFRLNNMGGLAIKVRTDDFDIGMLKTTLQLCQGVFTGFGFLGAKGDGKNYRLPFDAVSASVTCSKLAKRSYRNI